MENGVLHKVVKGCIRYAWIESFMLESRGTTLLAWVTLAGCFLLGFFHRFAPATFAGVIAADLGASSVALGTVFSFHFWVYTAAQIPAGLLVDRYGIRWCVAVGTLVTAGGSALLAAAPGVMVAGLGPALTGAGLSVVFVGIMKFNALWFRPEIYGVVTGVTMLLATLGAIVAGAPMAGLLEHYDWRLLFGVAALVGVVFSFAVALVVRDRAHTAAAAECPRLGWALSQRALWPLLLATLGTNGTFYAFAGLWGVPVLVAGRGLSNTAAVWYVTAAMATYCLGCLGIGVVSDRVGLRKPFVLATSALAVVGWCALAFLPWRPGWQAAALYVAVGAAAHTSAIASMIVPALVGLVAATRARETHCRPLPT